MKKNGKFFVPPPGNGMDLKELFAFLVTSGAGRPLGKDGYADGPWTPDLLTTAISELDSNARGIDIRTVQHWFQDNDNGIGTGNLVWLARILGCDDAKAAQEWQKELLGARRRLTARRRAARLALGKIEHSGQDGPSDIPEHDVERLPATLAHRTEALFNANSALNLPAAIIAGAVLLGFLAYVLGVHSVTYNPRSGVEKQVGFFWAPNWTLLNLIILPAFTISVANLLASWKERLRPALEPCEASENNSVGWHERVASVTSSVWITFFVSVGVVFGLQWGGIYLRALSNGDPGNLTIDWNLIALVRTDLLSTQEAIVLSSLAFLYTGFCVFIYLAGLVLTYAVANDFRELTLEAGEHQNHTYHGQLGQIGREMAMNVFRITLLGLVMILLMRLQGAYLVSDGSTITQWLADDALMFFSGEFKPGETLTQRSLAPYSTLLLLIMTLAVFGFAMIQSRAAMRITDKSEGTTLKSDARRTAKTDVPMALMLGTVISFVIAFLAIGLVAGFSLFLALALSLGILSWFRTGTDLHDLPQNSQIERSNRAKRLDGQSTAKH